MQELEASLWAILTENEYFLEQVFEDDGRGFQERVGGQGQEKADALTGRPPFWTCLQVK